MRHRVDRSYSQGLDCVRAYVATQRFRSQRSRPNKNISCAWRNLVVFFPNLRSRGGIAFCVAKVEKRQESDTVGRKWDRWNRQRIAPQCPHFGPRLNYLLPKASSTSVAASDGQNVHLIACAT